MQYEPPLRPANVGSIYTRNKYLKIFFHIFLFLFDQSLVVSIFMYTFASTKSLTSVFFIVESWAVKPDLHSLIIK